MPSQVRAGEAAGAARSIDWHGSANCCCAVRWHSTVQLTHDYDYCNYGVLARALLLWVGMKLAATIFDDTLTAIEYTTCSGCN